MSDGLAPCVYVYVCVCRNSVSGPWRVTTCLGTNTHRYASLVCLYLFNMCYWMPTLNQTDFGAGNTMVNKEETPVILGQSIYLHLCLSKI